MYVLKVNVQANASF